MEHVKYMIKKDNFTHSCNKIYSSKDFYEVLLISKGNCYFQLEDSFVSCNTETAIFLKPNTGIAMEFRNAKQPLEILSIQVLPDVLIELSDVTCDLERGFSFIPLDKSIIHLDTRDTTLIKNITKTMIALGEQKEEYGNALYEKNMLSILLILFLRSCIASDHVKLSHRQKELVMDDVFRFIRANLADDLSLEVLEKQFFVSKHHLCREFKKLTGQTLHSYIVKSRLDLSKKYIESGRPIKLIYQMCGFQTYQHFFRAFKKEYGMTPKEYYKSLTE